MKKIVVVLGLLTSLESYSQCCSPGNPTGGTVNQGTLEKKAGVLFCFTSMVTLKDTLQVLQHPVTGF